MDIGNRIKQRRIELELTADDLADRIGKSRATIYRYENGDIENIPTTVLEPMAEALRTTPAYLMGWADDPHDWEQIGNDEGIYPPRDYEGDYCDYVKYKILEENRLYWKQETNNEMTYQSFMHDYLGYDSPYTGDGYVDIQLEEEPDTIYRVSTSDYDDFFDLTKERLEFEFKTLLKRAEVIKQEDKIIPIKKE